MKYKNLIDQVLLMFSGLKYAWKYTRLSIILPKHKTINKLHTGLYTCKSVQSLPKYDNVYLWGPLLALNLPVYSPKRSLDLFGTCINI